MSDLTRNVLEWLARAASLAAVWFLLAGSTLATGIVWVLGGWDEPMWILCLLIAVDYILGVVCAYNDKCLNSSIGWKGIRKKGAYFAIVVVAHMFDHLTGDQVPLARTLTITLLSINDSLSVLEHAGKLGAPIPVFLLERIEKLRSQLGGLTSSVNTGGQGDGKKPV